MRQKRSRVRNKAGKGNGHLRRTRVEEIRRDRVRQGYSQKQRNSVSTHMAYTLKKPWAMR